MAGRVATDADAPVPRATVRLVAGADTVAATAADDDGRFLVRAPGAGRYRLIVTAVGYGTAEGDPFALAADAAQVVDVELRLAVGDLGGVAVEAERAVDRLDQARFYERRSQGLGRFFDRAMIETRRPRVLTDLFMNLPGFVPIVQEGDVRLNSINSITRNVNCRPTIVVDGTVLRSFGDAVEGGAAGGLPTAPLFNLDAALRIDDVEAIEAYAHGGIPAQYGGTMSPCGAILIWTRSHAASADAGDSVTAPPRQ